MIQFSSLPGIGPANPAKSALFGVVDAVFADMLAGESSQEPAMDGKLLPVAGNALPPAEKTALVETAALPLPVEPFDLEDEAGAPEPLPSDEHGTMPARDSDEGPAEAVIAPAKFFLDPTIPFAAPAQPEAAPEEGDPLPSGRKPPQPAVAARPEMKAANARPQDQAARVLPLLPTIEIPQARADQALDPRMAKLVPGLRPAISREFRIETGLQGRTPAKLAEPQPSEGRAALPTADFAAAPLADNSVAPAQAASRIAADTNAALRPHDFTALVDRLIEARDAVKPHAATMAVMHAEFGEVALRFSHHDGALSVTMSSHDPEFSQAVNAAMPAERAQNGDTGSQAGTNSQARREDAGHHGAFRSAANADSSGQNGSGRHGRETHRTTIERNDPATQPQKSARGRSGIFA